MALLMLILAFFVFFCVWTYRETYLDSPLQSKDIYCIMVTGKDHQRICFARESIANFFEQDYLYKKLIIINHAEEKVGYVDDSNSVVEFQVPKGNLTLGDLRNIALELVPINAMWTVWDDDDYRTNDYLSLLHNELVKQDADVVAFTHRIECNYNTKFLWKTTLESGFVTVLAKQDKRIKYKPLDTMEDTSLFDDFKKLGKRIVLLDNNPQIYIRLVHTNNTSLFVDKKRNSIPDNNVYVGPFKEESIDENLQKNILHFISNYFSKCL